MLDQLKDWWVVIAALVGGVFTYKMGQDRNTWRVDQLERVQKEQADKIEDLRRASSDRDLTMKVIETSLAQIKESIEGLREDLKGKADRER